MMSTDHQVHEPTIGRLVADASRDISTLIRSEIALAKSELRVSVKAGGIGLALLGTAAGLLLLGVIMLTVAFAHFLALIPFINLAFGFLIVFLVYAFLAAVLGFVGVRKLKQVHPPERAIEQAQRSKQVLQHRDIHGDTHRDTSRDAH